MFANILPVSPFPYMESMMRKTSLVLAVLGITVHLEAAAMSVEERVASQCATLSWRKGQSVSPLFPSLAGQNREYMVKTVERFQGWQAQERDDVAAGGGSRPGGDGGTGGVFQRPAREAAPGLRRGNHTRRPLHLSQRATAGPVCPACADCHGADGHGTAVLPRLAGQSSRYLLTQLKEFNQRTRTNDNQAMHMVASRLTEFEAKAVADYLSQMP